MTLTDSFIQGCFALESVRESSLSQSWMQLYLQA